MLNLKNTYSLYFLPLCQMPTRIQEWSCWAVICWGRVRLSSRSHPSPTGSRMLWWEMLAPPCSPLKGGLILSCSVDFLLHVCSAVLSSACLGLQLQRWANTSMHCDRNGSEEVWIFKMPMFAAVKPSYHSLHLPTDIFLTAAYWVRTFYFFKRSDNINIIQPCTQILPWPGG